MSIGLKARTLLLAAIFIATVFSAGHAFAADNIKGQVLLGGSPIAKSTVTLWEASADSPKQLDQTKSSDEGRFEVRAKGEHGDGVLYLIAAGGIPKAGKPPSFCSLCWGVSHRNRLSLMNSRP
jgi:hypothetical protein